MSYRRSVFISKAAKFLELTTENIIVINMEKGVFNKAVEYCKQKELPLKWSTPEFLKEYSTTARKILANISYTPNAKDLKELILNKKIDSYNLAKMNKEQLFPQLWAQIKLEVMQRHLPPDQEVSDGMFTCNKCKSKKTVYYQMQTRSADEPMTTYVTCTNCGAKWRC